MHFLSQRRAVRQPREFRREGKHALSVRALASKRVFTRLLLASAEFPSPPVRHLLRSSSRTARRLRTRPRRHHLGQDQTTQENRSVENWRQRKRSLPILHAGPTESGSSKLFQAVQARQLRVECPARSEWARLRGMVLYR